MFVCFFLSFLLHFFACLLHFFACLFVLFVLSHVKEHWALMKIGFPSVPPGRISHIFWRMARPSIRLNSKTHYVRPLVYRFPTQSEEFFLVQPLLKKSIRVLNVFSQLVGLQWLTVLNMLITWNRGITITLTGDWHSGRLAALSPSIMLRNSLLTEGNIRNIYVSALKHNCNVMLIAQISVLTKQRHKSTDLTFKTIKL